MSGESSSSITDPISGETIVEFISAISDEEIERELIANINAATAARVKYAEAVKQIMKEPENWSTLSK